MASNTYLYAIKRLFGRGPTTRSVGDILTMVLNHLLTRMILLASSNEGGGCEVDFLPYKRHEKQVEV